jgi:hypothetical protein
MRKKKATLKRLGGQEDWLFLYRKSVVSFESKDCQGTNTRTKSGARI